MRNILLLILGVFSSCAFGQELNALDSETFDKKNEIRVNAFDLVAAGTLGVGYERYLKNNQSVSADMYFFDNYSYFDIGYEDYKSNAFSLKLAYNIYFSKKREFKGFFFSPFMRFRAGNLEYKDYYYDINGNYFEYPYEQKLSGFQVGFGIGNKWRISNDRVVLGLQGEIARQLGGDIDTDYYSNVEFRLGVNLGFTF